MPINNFFQDDSIKTRELGRISKGELVGKKLIDLDYFKFTSSDPAITAAFNRVYGSKPRSLKFRFPQKYLSDAYYEFTNNAYYVAALASPKGYYQVAKSNGDYIVSEKFWTTNPISKKPATKWRTLSEGEKPFDPAGYRWTGVDGSTSLLPWTHTTFINLELTELNEELLNAGVPTGTVTLWVRAANEIHTLAQNINYVMEAFGRINIGPRDQLNSAIPLVLIREDETINAQYGGEGFAGVTKAQKSLVRIVPSAQLSNILTRVEQQISEQYIIQKVTQQLTGGQPTVNDVNNLLFGEVEPTPAKLARPQIPSSTTMGVDTFKIIEGEIDGDYEDGPDEIEIDLPDGMYVTLADNMSEQRIEFTDTICRVVHRGHIVEWGNEELVALHNVTEPKGFITHQQLLDCKALANEYDTTYEKVIPRLLTGMSEDGQRYDAPSGALGALVWSIGYKRFNPSEKGSSVVANAKELYDAIVQDVPF